jgi:hypothetical protein
MGSPAVCALKRVIRSGREMKLSAVLGLAIVDLDQFSLRAPFPEGLPAPMAGSPNGPVGLGLLSGRQFEQR